MAAELALLVGIARRHRLEVGARAEIAAAAGEHGNRRCLIGIERKEGVVQLPRGRAVDGVAAMRAVDGNDGDGTIVFDEHGIGFDHISALHSAFIGGSLTLPIYSMPSLTKATRMVGSPIASWASSKRTRLVMTCSGWK